MFFLSASLRYYFDSNTRVIRIVLVSHIETQYVCTAS